MHVERPSGSAPATLFRALFLVFALLVLAAAGYAGWIVIRYWDQVGV